MCNVSLGYVDAQVWRPEAMVDGEVKVKEDVPY